MLNYRFSASERTRNCGNTALCNREKCIDNTLTRNKRNIKRKLLLIGSALSNRPFLHKRNLSVAAFCCNYSNRFGYGKFAAFYIFNCAAHAVRHHYTLSYNRRLFYRTEYVACLYAVACSCHRHKVPFCASVKTVNLNTSCKVVSADFHYFFKRSLNTVVNAAYKTRTKFNRKRRTCCFDRFARF